MKFDYSGVDLTTQQTVSGDIEALSESKLGEHKKTSKSCKSTEKNRSTESISSDPALPLQEMATLTESGVF